MLAVVVQREPDVAELGDVCRPRPLDVVKARSLVADQHPGERSSAIRHGERPAQGQSIRLILELAHLYDADHHSATVGLHYLRIEWPRLSAYGAPYHSDSS